MVSDICVYYGCISLMLVYLESRILETWFNFMHVVPLCYIVAVYLQNLESAFFHVYFSSAVELRHNHVLSKSYLFLEG